MGFGRLRGLLIGALLGTAAGRLILYLRRVHRETVGFDDFLALGLIAFSYGAALLLHTYGFLAVFAAGLALRRVEVHATGQKREPEELLAAVDATDDEDVATHPETAPAYMAQTVLAFTEQLERIGEVAVMLLIGAMLSLDAIPPAALVRAPAPAGDSSRRRQPGDDRLGDNAGAARVYQLVRHSRYRLDLLMYAIVHGVPEQLASWLTGMTLAVVTTSVVVHGISVTPLMRHYGRTSE